MAFRGRVRALFPSMLLLLACLGLAGAYSFFAIRGYQSFALSGATDKKSLQRAVLLGPRNAFAYNRLCRYKRDVDLDPKEALSDCERAVELNRLDPSYWLDLAQVFYELGDISQEKTAIKQALSVDPTTPEVAWNAGNLFLLDGDVEPAMSLFALVLREDPSRVALTLRNAWRALGQVDPILRILPPQPEQYLQFIALLVSKNRKEDAAQVWQRMIDLQRPVPYGDALFYINALLSWDEVKQANRAWQQMGAGSDDFAGYIRSDKNLVVNGTFESTILNSGFDWRTAPSPGTKITVDETNPRSGQRSLSISFGSPVADSGLYQLVPVEPSSAYGASAWLRTEELQTANGPRLTITDASSGAVLAISEPVAYTTSWRQELVRFETGPETDMVAIRLTRDHPNTVIRGNLWIDDVQLSKASASSQDQQPMKDPTERK